MTTHTPTNEEFARLVYDSEELRAQLAQALGERDYWKGAHDALRAQRDELLAFAQRSLASIEQRASKHPLSEWETLLQIGSAAISRATGVQHG